MLLVLTWSFVQLNDLPVCQILFYNNLTQRVKLIACQQKPLTVWIVINNLFTKYAGYDLKIGIEFIVLLPQLHENIESDELFLSQKIQLLFRVVQVIVNKYIEVNV